MAQALPLRISGTFYGGNRSQSGPRPIGCRTNERRHSMVPNDRIVLSSLHTKKAPVKPDSLLFLAAGPRANNLAEFCLVCSAR